jgi:competence protein ComEC
MRLKLSESGLSRTGASDHALATQPLLLVAVAFALGIVADRFGSVLLVSRTASDWWAAAGIATALAIILCHGHYLRTSLVALLFACLFLGGSWHDLRWNYCAKNDLARYAAVTTEPVCLKAIAMTPSSWRPAAETTPLRAIPAEPRSEVEIQVTRLRNGTRWQQASGTVRLRVNGVLPDITPGDQLLVFARLSELRPVMNPGQFDFSLADRAAGHHCELFTQSPACVSVLEPASSLSLETWLAAAGRLCQRQLTRYVGFDQQSMAQALTLGVQGELNDETMDAFMNTGTIHLVVVSGMHVGLIAVLVGLVASFLPVSQSTRLVLIICCVLAYAAIVGPQPSVVRSTIFVVFSLLAIARFRHLNVVNSLAAAALLVMVINPAELLRTGTQLSFLGVAAVVASIAWLWPHDNNNPLERMIASYQTWSETIWNGFKQQVWLVFVASIAAWVVVTPLLLYNFNIISPSSVVLTPLAWLPMSLALVAGLLICTVGFVFAPIAWLLGKVCGICLLLSERIIELGSRVPGSYAYFAGPALWWLIVFYAALACFALLPSWRPNLKNQAILAMLWIAFGLAVSIWNHRSSDQLQCTFLSVGHGTCVVLELPSGETFLYDAGSLGSPEGTTNVISSFLWSQGITHIDAVVISHADVDHYNGLPGLLERFSVDQIFVSPLMFDPWATQGELTAPNFLKEKITQAGVPLEVVWMNDVLPIEDERVNIEVLHPPQFGVAGLDNANSILLLIEFAGQRFLLPGDLESPGIEAVMAEAPLDVDVLLAPHHGSNNSDPPGFANWCTPDWVVLSGRYQPSQTQLTTASYSEAGAQIFHTSRSGAVEFTVSSSGLDCRVFREN